MLLLLLLAGAYGLTRLSGPPGPEDYDHQDGELLAAAEQLRLAAASQSDKPANVREDFPFDPNTVSHRDLRRLGLSDRQATAWVRYREKRPFRTVEDISRLRVLHPDQASHLQNLAYLPPTVADPENRPAAAEVPAERFFFDPNTVSADSFRRLGFSERETNALLKYRSYRPVTFRQPEDLLRVSALDSQHLAAVLDLVRIAVQPSVEPAPAATPGKQTDTLVYVDINRATVVDWTQLPGIGPYRAERIVKYREALGGFATVAQVGTTYGLPDSVYTTIAPRLRGSPILRPLYINRLDANELARHPLLKRSTATVIVRYRENHGPFHSAEDLKKVRALSTENLSELLPYLNFDP